VLDAAGEPAGQAIEIQGVRSPSRRTRET
jgi:hypothetical protein